jgi:hypothetical protein
MDQQLPIGLQVALGAGSGATVVIAAVAVHAWFSVRKQLDRVVAAVEHVEAEIIPLARETRVVVDRLRGLSEQTASVAGGLLLPFRTVNTALTLLQTGVTTFLQALWTGRRRQPDHRQEDPKETLS